MLNRPLSNVAGVVMHSRCLAYTHAARRDSVTNAATSHVISRQLNAQMFGKVHSSTTQSLVSRQIPIAAGFTPLRWVAPKLRHATLQCCGAQVAKRALPAS